VRPPKAGYKVKFKCWRCGEWGDEFDLMKDAYPNEDYPSRRVRLEQWRRDYEREATSILRGPGSTKNMKQQQTQSRRNDPQDVASAWASVTIDYDAEETDQPFALHILNKFKHHCDQNDVSMEALLKYWRDFEDWVRETDLRHLAECDDPQCEAVCCRAERGLPPLTKAEIEAGRQERLETKRQQRERVRKALRKTPQ